MRARSNADAGGGCGHGYPQSHTGVRRCSVYLQVSLATVDPISRGRSAYTGIRPWLQRLKNRRPPDAWAIALPDDTTGAQKPIFTFGSAAPLEYFRPQSDHASLRRFPLIRWIHLLLSREVVTCGLKASPALSFAVNLKDRPQAQALK
jgi:hypothetical protein